MASEIKTENCSDVARKIHYQIMKGNVDKAFETFWRLEHMVLSSANTGRRIKAVLKDAETSIADLQRQGRTARAERARKALSSFSRDPGIRRYLSAVQRTVVRA